MMSVRFGATKKAFRERAVGQDAASVFLETSVFGPEYKGAGQYPVVGPSPYERKWYAVVCVDSAGKVVKVK